MSVRVNLLPQATREHDRMTRQRGGLVAAFVVLLLLLLLLFLWQNSRIATADEELAAEQARLSELQGEAAQLQEFQQLEERLRSADELVTSVLGDEVSVAGILQDLAVVMPSDAQFDDLAITVGRVEAFGPAERMSVGSLTANGQSLNNHAPGVERLLLELDKMAVFHDLFVTDSRLEDPEEPFVTFSLESQLGPESRTGRYLDGVPEELR
jgi:Tfp pilus assembly protein PilN